MNVIDDQIIKLKAQIYDEMVARDHMILKAQEIEKGVHTMTNRLRELEEQKKNEK